MDTFGRNYAKGQAQLQFLMRSRDIRTFWLNSRRLPNFAPLGDTLEVEALIGLSDFAIFPKIVFETSLGANIYKVPIQAAQGQQRFCFGGNINQLTSDAMGGQGKGRTKEEGIWPTFFFLFFRNIHGQKGFLKVKERGIAHFFFLFFMKFSRFPTINRKRENFMIFRFFLDG